MGFYDSETYVITYSNSNPNFILKKELSLQGVSAIYSMNTAPNLNSTELGEYFKLIPVSIENIYHHLTHKALSPIELVSNVSISDDFRKIQICSTKLGSDGAVEIVGGRGNSAEFNIIGDTSLETAESIS